MTSDCSVGSANIRNYLGIYIRHRSLLCLPFWEDLSKITLSSVLATNIR